MSLQGNEWSDDLCLTLNIILSTSISKHMPLPSQIVIVDGFDNSSTDIYLAIIISQKTCPCPVKQQIVCLTLNIIVAMSISKDLPLPSQTTGEYVQLDEMDQCTK